LCSRRNGRHKAHTCLRISSLFSTHPFHSSLAPISSRLTTTIARNRKPRSRLCCIDIYQLDLAVLHGHHIAVSHTIDTFHHLETQICPFETGTPPARHLALSPFCAISFATSRSLQALRCSFRVSVSNLTITVGKLAFCSGHSQKYRHSSRRVPSFPTCRPQPP
jgi:hypothetical protein